MSKQTPLTVEQCVGALRGLLDSPEIRQAQAIVEQYDHVLRVGQHRIPVIKGALLEDAVVGAPVQVTSAQAAEPLLKDICVLIYHYVGQIIKNTSDSQWRKLTLERKYDIATSANYILLGIALFRDCEVVDIIQDGAVIGVAQLDYSSRTLYPIYEDTNVAELCRRIITTQTIFTLKDALTLKAEGWFKRNMDSVVGSVKLRNSPNLEGDLRAQVCMKSYTESWETFQARVKNRRLGQVGKVNVNAMEDVATYSHAVDTLWENFPKSNAQRQGLSRHGTATEDRQGGAFSMMTLGAVGGAAVAGYMANKAVDEIRDRVDPIINQVMEFKEKTEQTVTNAEQTLAQIAVTSGKAETLMDMWIEGTQTVLNGLGFGEDSDYINRAISLGCVIFDIFDGTWKYPNPVSGITKITLRVLSAIGLAGKALQLAARELQTGFLKVADWLMTQFYKVRSGETRQANIGSLFKDAKEIVSTIFTTAYLAVTSKLPSKNDLKNLLVGVKDFNALVTFGRNLKTFIFGITDLINKALRTALSYVYPPLGMYMRCITGGDVAQWYDKATDWLDNNKKDGRKYFADKVFQQELKDIYNEGRSFVADAMLNSALQKTAIGTGLGTIMKTLQPLYDRLLEWDGSKPTRDIPYGIYIYGKPGVGKSTIVSALVDMLIDPSVPAGNRTYTRNVQEQFWSGYRRQAAVILDDVGNYANAKDADDIIKIFSPVPIPLDMGPVDEKGFNFTSGLVLMTSNVAFMKTNAIVTKEALWRRRHYAVEMTLTVDEGVADADRICPDPSVFKEDMSHARFQRFVTDHQGPNGEIIYIGDKMSYADFMTSVAEDYIKFTTTTKTMSGTAVGIAQTLNGRICTLTNAVRQSKKYSSAEMRKADNTFFYLEHHPFDPIDDTEPYDEWCMCCEHEGCPLPEDYIAHDHIIRTWSEVRGLAEEHYNNAEIIRCTNKLDRSWLSFYRHLDKKAMRTTTIDFSDKYEYYVRTNVKVADITSTWYEKTVALWNPKDFIKDHWVGIYVGLTITLSIGGLLYQIYSQYQVKKKALTTLTEIQARRDIGETPQADHGSPNAKEQAIRARRFQDPFFVSRQSAMATRMAEITPYFTSDDLTVLQDNYDSDQERLSQERWMLTQKMVNDVVYFFTEEFRPEIDEDDDKRLNINNLEKSSCELAVRYRRLVDNLQLLLRTPIGSEEFSMIVASVSADRDYILIVIALLGYDNLVDEWRSLGVDIVPSEGNVIFINRIRRLIIGSVDFERIIQTNDGRERAYKFVAGATDIKKQAAAEVAKVEAQRRVTAMEVRQSAADPNADELLKSLVKSMLTIKVVSAGRDKTQMYESEVNAVSVMGTYLLVPAHVFCDYTGQLLKIGHAATCKCGQLGHENIVTVKTAWSSGKYADVIFDPRNFQVLKSPYGEADLDVGVFYFGPRLVPLKNNIHHFVERAQVERLTRFPADLLVLRDVQPNVTPFIMRTEISPLTKTVSYPMDDPAAIETIDTPRHEVSMMNGWEYQAPTIEGDCGGLIVCRSARMMKKLVGVHVSIGRKAGTSYSEVVTRERIEEALAELERKNGRTLSNAVRNGLSGMTGLEEVADNTRTPEGNFTVVGQLPKKELPRIAEKTNLEKSMIHGKLYPSLMEPAILSPKDPRLKEYGLPEGFSPLWNGLKKFGQRTKEFHPDRLRKAVDYVKQQLFFHMDVPQKQRRICTEHEAINGHAEYGWEHMDLKTSPGFQYAKGRKPGMVGKEHLFTGGDLDKQVTDPKLREDLDRMERDMRNGTMSDNLWTCTLKDEKREIWKVKLGKTRVFIAAPVAFTVLCRKYNLSFASAFIAARLKIPSAVGMAPFSAEWNDMITQLEENGDFSIAGDFGNWDGHMHPEVIDAICDIVNEWYGGTVEECTARRVLFTEMVHNMEVAGNLVFYKHYGNPSGNPLTTTINTIGNMIYFALAWLDLAPDCYGDLSFYQAFVKIFFYGDDHLGTVKSQARSFYNMLTLQAWFVAHGHDYTPPEKNKQIDYEFGNVYSDMFLKCKTVKIGGMYWPLMDRNTISEMINWIRKGEDSAYIATVKNCSDACRFLFFYGQTIFNEERNKMQAELDKAARRDKQKQPSVLPSWDFYNELFGKEKGFPFLVYSAGGLFGLTDEALGRKVEYSNAKRQSKVGPSTDDTEPRAMTMSPNEENDEGIVRANQSEPERVKEIKTFTKSKLATGHMSDNRWDIAKLVERATLVDTFSWATTHVTGSLIWQKYVPLEMLVADSVNHVPFDWFHVWRGKVLVTFQVNGTQWHAGRLAVVWVPLLSKSEASGYYKDNLSAVTSVHHGELDPAVSNIIEMEINFCHPKDYIRPTMNDDRATEQLGTLCVYVLSDLRCGETSKHSVDISVHVQFLENEFKVLRGVESTTRGGAKWSNALRQGNTFTTNNNFKDARDVTIGQKAEADGIGSGMAQGATLRLDKPNMTLEPPVVATSTMGYMSHCENIPFMERLSLEPGKVMRIKPEHFGRTRDEMDMISMRQVFGLDRAVNWSVGNISGTVLTSGFMCPLSKVLENKLTFGGPAISVTTLDYLSAKNTFWKGGIKVKIVVVGCSFHVGKLFFGLDYGDVKPPTTLLGATSEYGVYLDINEGRHEFEYIIKFQSDTAAKRVPNGFKGGFGKEENLKYATGVWSLRVVNELVAPHETADSVSVMIYFAADEDYRTYGLDFNNRSLTAIAPAFVASNAKRQSKGGEAIAGEDKPARTDNFGECFDHIQNFLKRFCLCYEHEGTTGGESYTWSFNMAYLTYGNEGAAQREYGRACGLWNYFGASYAGQRGTLRFKISRKTVTDAGMSVPTAFVVSYCPLGFVNSNARSPIVGPEGDPNWSELRNSVSNMSPPFSYGNGTLATAAQIEVPFMSRYNFARRNPRSGADGIDDEFTLGTIFLSNQYTIVNEKDDLQMYLASGDEFRFGIWLGPPKLQCYNGNVSFSMWPDTYQKTASLASSTQASQLE